MSRGVPRCSRHFRVLCEKCGAGGDRYLPLGILHKGWCAALQEDFDVALGIKAPQEEMEADADVAGGERQRQKKKGGHGSNGRGVAPFKHKFRTGGRKPFSAKM